MTDFTLLIQTVKRVCTFASILVLVVPGVILAQEAGQQFKRLKVEDRPVGQKINIQIEPEPNTIEEPEIVYEAPFVEDEEDLIGEAPGTATWFWSRFSPTLESASILSLQTAQRINGPEAEQLDPNLVDMQALVARYGKDLLRAGAESEVSPALLLAIMFVESRGQPSAISSAGAQGVMQLIPATAERFGVLDAHDPSQAIPGAARYMKFLLEEFRGDAILALAGYNAGENAVLNHGGVPPYAETRNYVPKVVAAWRIARRLCTGPQDYATDGCVFITMG